MSDSRYRIIHSPRLSAEENIAIDRRLLDAFDEGSRPLFRLYGWEPSLTIGAAQTFEACVALAPALERYRSRYAKRMTGGGILYHGEDLSYSLILPPAMMRGFSVKEGYARITAFLLDFYRSLGLDPHWAKDDPDITLSHDPFCQSGYEAYDIIIQGHKIGGNAQKRTKKAIFQHGSVPLRRNAHGISLEDFGIVLKETEIRERLTDAANRQIKEWTDAQ